MTAGIDYAFYPHPSPAAIKADGNTFVCRYTSAYQPSDTQGKNLLAAEKNALLAAGLSIVIVAEEDAGRMLSGYGAGAADAIHADAVVKALSMSGIPVYFACDWDATEAQQPTINTYLDGAASVIGRARTGIYGGYYPVKRALDAGKAAYAWQTFAWSGGQWDPRADLRQTQNDVTIDGASCDRDVAMAADYGQWPRPGPVPTVAQWVCEGMLSLHDLAATQLHCDVPMVLWMTAENSPFSMFTAGMATYLNQVFAADKVKVPAGITVWHPDVSTTTPFHSHGTQTLQGLANTWACQPSAIVRLTAEHSPGAVFDGAMASYLDGVFQRSTVHVPTGTVLFYLQG